MSAQNDAAGLVVAIPSKGRLQENANAFFARAGLPVAQAGGARGYRGSIAGLPGVEVAFLSASEIAQELARGAVHFGVTGLDLVHETVNAPEKSLEMLCPLGFGHADVVVAAPEAWIDVAGMADVEDVAAHFQRRHGRPLRVATKYVALTRAFFARHGIVDYRIVESLGATEGAPAAGTAELIVDITTTGATLAANGLKIVETILRSEAHLVASLTAPWNGGQQALARRLLGRIAAEEEARLSRRVLVAVPAGARPAIAAVLATEPEVRCLGEDDAGLTLLARRGRVADLADALIAAGASDVAVASVDMLFRAQNPLFDRLSARLG